MQNLLCKVFHFLSSHWRTFCPAVASTPLASPSNKEAGDAFCSLKSSSARGSWLLFYQQHQELWVGPDLNFSSLPSCFKLLFLPSCAKGEGETHILRVAGKSCPVLPCVARSILVGHRAPLLSKGTSLEQSAAVPVPERALRAEDIFLYLCKLTDSLRKMSNFWVFPRAGSTRSWG